MSDIYVLLDDLNKRVSEIEFHLSLGSSVPPGSESALRELLDALKIVANAMDPNLAAQPDSNKKTSDSLGSSVPPGSESALRNSSSDKPPLTSRADSEIPERGEICKRRCHRFEQPILNNSRCLNCGWTSGEIFTAQHEENVLLAGGPPTPDLAAQPDSTTIRYTVEDDAGTRTVEIPETHRIGVHDYASFVSCLRSNFKLVFGEDQPFIDPQDMIQRMTAEIQELRRGPGVRNND